MYRWLKLSGVHLSSEGKQRALCKEMLGDNLEVELAPFSFKLPNGGEGIRGAAHGYTPSLTSKITQLLEQNDKYVTMDIAPSMQLSYLQRRQAYLT